MVRIVDCSLLRERSGACLRTLQVDNFHAATPIVRFPNEIREILPCNFRFALDLADIFFLLFQLFHAALEVDG